MNRFRENKTEIYFLLGIGLFINIFLYLSVRGFYISFFDTDDFMRLIRIRQFFSDFDLSNNIIQRCNVPYGCDLHWTRLYDFFLIIPSYILSFFTESVNKAIEYVGFFITPVTKSIVSLLIYGLFLKYTNKYQAFLISMFFIAHTLIVYLGIFGRPDHHMFIIMCILIWLTSISDFIEKPESKKYQISSTVATFLCIWASPETLMPLLLTDTVLFLHFFKDDRKLYALYRKDILTAAFICALEISSGSLSVDYDKISTVHSVLYLFGSVIFLTVSKIGGNDLKRRIAFSAVFSVIMGITFLILYPKFIYGMSGNVDSYAKIIWLNRVHEMQSPFEKHLDFCMAFYPVMFAAVFYGFFILKFKKNTVFWHIISINAFFYTLFSCFAWRMLPYSVLFGIPLVVFSVMNARLSKKLPRYVRSLSAIVLIMFLPILFVEFETGNLQRNR